VAELYEVVFEGIGKHNVVPMFAQFVSMARDVTVISSAEDAELMVNNRLVFSAMESSLDAEGGLIVMAELHELRVGEITLPSVLLRIVRYDGTFDLDFTFDAHELVNTNVGSVMQSLHMAGKKLSERFNARSFFGGMEPASDANTRYFTDSNIGPLGRAQ
jgi:hypothetical protein